MSDTEQRAAQARSLTNNNAFKEISEEIEQQAVETFRNPASQEAQIIAAHEFIRAVDIYRAAIQSRIDAWDFEQEKLKKDAAP